ncbi:putative leucine-rich repeat domain, L domain-containing protein [Medicago truncatula]|uniref:NBS-LRR resistance protein n=1 Tax=Medicago truncatula TaxID=3880 RepID=G7KKL6_MEDTR|nr:putative disease resistance protein RGA1 [Medicago truncatula]AES75552.1 NBS-LRR resistance protein [Medicago truncatula]RHN51410.1 putative leucine-rich repeat domain, L domain-containing protein [Medicago truncatula]
MPSTTFTVRPNAGFSLADLPNLQPGDNLHIKGLQNLRNGGDVREPNLSSMRLNRLHLAWDRNTNSTNSAEEVLGALRPHRDLTGFRLSGYRGMNIPNWMTDISILGRLVDVKLMNCINCSQLPPLGKLPFLNTLYLSQMTNVKYIDDSPYEISTENAFPSLTEMTLFDLPNLERVLRIEGVEMLSQLSKLSIQSIPQFELPSLPSVKEVYVGGETEEDIDHEASFLRDIAGKMPNLKELMIDAFHQLTVLPNELSSLRSLEELYIIDCNKLESIPNNVFYGLISLRILSFVICHSLNSLPQSVTTLTSLQRLIIHYCPELILPANMNMLNSLREVSIMGGDRRRGIYNGLEDIPLLQNLSLRDFPSLRSLPDWLGDTLSLQELEISKFPKLTSLPDNFDQLENLQKLCIDRCPRLVNRLARRTGEDWYKIAHVPILSLRLESDVVHPINEEEYSNSDNELDMEVDEP